MYPEFPYIAFRKPRYFWCNLYMKIRYFAYSIDIWGCAAMRLWSCETAIFHSLYVLDFQENSWTIHYIVYC